jgi:D-alanyl-D-alanine dipeptidase
VLGETHRRFGGRCFITSLTRTLAYQRSVQKAYPRAAADGNSPSRRSSHLTGSTVDIAFREMPAKARPWLRRRLLALETAQAVQATEERLCFHVMVFPDYSARASKIH